MQKISTLSEAKTVISIGSIYKYFLLPHEKNNSLKRSFTSLLKKTLNKNYVEKQEVLHNINLDINQGDFFGIVGRNGSGKSTLLKIIAGIYQPSKGKIAVEGKIVPFIELGVGFNPELTARDNVYLNGALLGFSRKQINEKFTDIVRFAELEKFIDQTLKNYSSGMQVRLAFSIATRLAESDILLIDEVLAVGDAKFQRKCFDYFNRLKKEKKTVIFVTHDMNAIQQYCTRAMLIEASKQVLVGTPEEVAREYTKLFQVTDETETGDSKDGMRYGTKKIEIESIKTNKSVYNPIDKTIEINCVIKAVDTFDDVIYGISLMNEAGQRLFGTNTTLMKRKIPRIGQKDKLTLSWTLPNILNAGEYKVCPEVILSNSEVCDSWEEATAFSVNNSASTPFPVNPTLELEAEIRT